MERYPDAHLYARHVCDHNGDAAVRTDHDPDDHGHHLPHCVAVDDGYQSVDHTAVQFGDVEFGDVEFGDIEFGDHLTHSGDRGRRAHNEDAEANTSNQHHPLAIPASDQLTL